MQSLARHYPDWKAPSEDGQVVIWPEPRELLADTLENHKQLAAADSVRLQNIPLPQLRSHMRQFFGHDDSQPLVATGHQAELYHAGVWVKNALIDAAAQKLGGQAFHVAVDTDAPKHLSIRWPGESLPLTDDGAAGAWSGLLSPPSPAHLDRILSKLREAAGAWDFVPVLPTVIELLRRLAMQSDLTLPAALTNSTHELDWQLGLRHHVLLASPIWTSDPFLVFAHHFLSRADAVAHHYNAALAAYRAVHGIKSHMRPMPDLFTSDQATEAPFWLDDLHTGRRVRPSVFGSDGGWMIKLVGGEEFVFEPNLDGWEAASRLQKWLSITRHRLSPRALTLTMFLRLTLVDQFVHGIGGGQYDQVTDHFIANFFNTQPPTFGVTTATMYFPTALGQQRVCVPCVKQEGHRLWHELLGSRKRELVGQIAALPRRSSLRSAKFFEMHRELASAAARSDAVRRWQEKLRQTQQREKEEQSLFDRELFYAIQPRERLVEMIHRYRAALS